MNPYALAHQARRLLEANKNASNARSNGDRVAPRRKFDENREIYRNSLDLMRHSGLQRFHASNEDEKEEIVKQLEQEGRLEKENYSGNPRAYEEALERAANRTEAGICKSTPATPSRSNVC